MGIKETKQSLLLNCFAMKWDLKINNIIYSD